MSTSARALEELERSIRSPLAPAELLRLVAEELGRPVAPAEIAAAVAAWHGLFDRELRQRREVLAAGFALYSPDDGWRGLGGAAGLELALALRDELALALLGRGAALEPAEARRRADRLEQERRRRLRELAALAPAPRDPARRPPCPPPPTADPPAV